MQKAPVHNPALGGWYRAVSTYDAKQYGPPAGAGEWVEYTKGRFPGPGLLHRVGQPDQKVEVLASAGCSMLPSGQRVCTVFAREMGPADMIRYQLPNGEQGRANGHRLYTTPSGQLTSNPHVIQNVTKFKEAWLPASYDATKPGGIKGSWVQVSGKGEGATAVVHAPGLGTQVAELKAVRPDTWGRLRALVRWRQSPNPNGFRRANAGQQVALTTSVANNDKWWCALIPGARGCVTQRVDNPARARNAVIGGGGPGGGGAGNGSTIPFPPSTPPPESVPFPGYPPPGPPSTPSPPIPPSTTPGGPRPPVAPPGGGPTFQAGYRAPGGYWGGGGPGLASAGGALLGETCDPPDCKAAEDPDCTSYCNHSVGGHLPMCDLNCPPAVAAFPTPWEPSRPGPTLTNPNGFVSAAAARAQINRGAGLIAAVQRGAAKVVIDAQGVKLVAA